MYKDFNINLWQKVTLESQTPFGNNGQFLIVSLSIELEHINPKY